MKNCLLSLCLFVSSTAFAGQYLGCFESDFQSSKKIDDNAPFRIRLRLSEKVDDPQVTVYASYVQLLFSQPNSQTEIHSDIFDIFQNDQKPAFYGLLDDGGNSGDKYGPFEITQRSDAGVTIKIHGRFRYAHPPQGSRLYMLPGETWTITLKKLDEKYDETVCKAQYPKG